MTDQHYQSYQVWDLPTRLFHWLNVICLLGLIAVGTAILWAGALGLASEGKILLKSIHVYFGYVFAVNLLIRLIWAFMGNRHARWRGFLPFSKGYMGKLKSYMAAEKSAAPEYYLGHNPKGKLAVTALFILLLTMAVTGLVLAGTDIYFPPFGAKIQEWVAASGVNPSEVVPYVKDNVDEVAYKEMRAFRKTFIFTHYWAFFGVLGLIILHIAAVIITEIKSGGGLISAMFTGRKVLPREPEDK
ncbi:MAG: cytochrome b/b6 domain-containing protein [Emcibacter sp.]|nr:cytochrome b/b6 domain-containing protein [Emcibacter sp.]